MANQSNSGLAAILSIIPGLGQIYKGHVIMGIIWFLLLGTGYFFGWSHGFLSGGIIALILHIICIIQAYKM